MKTRGMGPDAGVIAIQLRRVLSRHPPDILAVHFVDGAIKSPSGIKRSGFGGPPSHATRLLAARESIALFAVAPRRESVRAKRISGYRARGRGSGFAQPYGEAENAAELWLSPARPSV